MPRDWRDGGEDRETLVARAGLSHRDQQEEEEEGEQQTRPAHQDSVYKYENNIIVDTLTAVFGPRGSGFISQRYGSGFFPFLIKVLSGLK